MKKKVVKTPGRKKPRKRKVKHPVRQDVDRPPYRIPLVSETMAEPRNGLTVVSTFAGGGGSSYGYWMAGYTVKAALEFDKPAVETYRANYPDTPVIMKDIREVTAEEVLEVAGVKKGELDILDGSPPCTCFSMAGKREKGWGKAKQYTATSKKQIVDDLFFVYANLLKGIQPRAFVAENVKGLVIGKAKGYFKLILRALRDCGYRVKARVLDGQWLGVPQRRQRLIFVGIRDDLDLEPEHPKPLTYRYSIQDACPWIKRLYVGRDSKVRANIPSPTILGSDGGRSSSGFDHGLGYVDAPVLVEGVVPDYPQSSVDSNHDYTQGYHPMDEPSPAIMGSGVTHFWISQHHVEAEAMLKGAVGREWDRLAPGEQSGKYFNMIKANLDEPSPTVLGVGGSSPGIATVVLPHEKRKFTIPELRRICGFPDDYELTGPYGERWARLGRSVPPPMTKAIALVVAKTLAKAR